MGLEQCFLCLRIHFKGLLSMILINNINLPLNTDFGNLKPIVSKELKIGIDKIKNARLYRKSVDARKKNNVHFCCSVFAELTVNEAFAVKKCKNAVIFEEKKYIWKRVEKSTEKRPVVVGFGPAGMFAGLTLARAGLNPIIIERGSEVDKRTKAVEAFFSGGALNPECNVQFGEGGAGTFSDGKLNTGIKNPRCRTVLEVLNQHGAPDKILYEAKPHIGTDILINVVKSIRNEIISLGGEVRFDTKLTNVKTENGKITAAVTENEEIPCDSLIIATGHSARDTFSMLLENGLVMIKKPFAVGVRIEHLQKDINRSLYGDFADSEYLGAADYKLAVHLNNGRGVYTFCMCPGGEVINASSESGGIAVNGMSKSQRDGINSNSALLVGVEPEDFQGEDVLSGCRFQEQIERKAYEICNGAVPVTTVGNLVFGDEFKITSVNPTIKPNYSFADFSELFPNYIIESLKEGILEFGKKIKGFDDKSAVLTAPETRSSSPVRILRGEDLQSVTVKGVYPCGEGAGYAGGIVSAAVDGITVAEEIINLINKA